MEPINVIEWRFGLFPAKFSWRDEIFKIDAVTECRTILAASGRSEAYQFLVRVGDKLWYLRQAVASGQWWLHRKGDHDDE